MNLIKKFKDYYKTKKDHLALGKNAFDVLGKSVVPVDLKELQYICQDLIDFGFNSDTGKIKLHFSGVIDSRLRDTLFKMLYHDGGLKIPIMKDRVLFNLDFNFVSRMPLLYKGNIDLEKFLDILEEMVDRIEDEFKVELYDENVPSNRIIKQNGDFILKVNPDGVGNYKPLNLTQNYDRPGTFIPNQFILAFRLKNEHS